MKEELISLNTAKLAKEKGFNEISERYYDKTSNGKLESVSGYDLWNNYKNAFSAPTQSLLQKWLREIYNIDLIVSQHYKRLSYGCEVYHYNKDNTTGYTPIELGSFKTYEGALEAGLQEALKLIKI